MSALFSWSLKVLLYCMFATFPILIPVHSVVSLSVFPSDSVCKCYLFIHFLLLISVLFCSVVCLCYYSGWSVCSLFIHSFCYCHLYFVFPVLLTSSSPSCFSFIFWSLSSARHKQRQSIIISPALATLSADIAYSFCRNKNPYN